MTERELHKLRREDLLQLLISQSKEVAQLRLDLDRVEEERGQLKESNDRLKEKLNTKDEQLGLLAERLDEKDQVIEKLKGRLDTKDEIIKQLRTASRLTLNADGSMGIRLEDIFDAAKTAAESYVKSLLPRESDADRNDEY